MKHQSMKLVLMGLFLVITRSYGSAADVSGTWSGTLLPSGSTDPHLACSASVSITQSTTSLVVEGGSLRCPTFVMPIAREPFTIEHGYLMSIDGERHGVVDSITVDLEFPFRGLEMHFMPQRNNETYLLLRGTSPTGRPIFHDGFLTR
jgi:hypothetical protein